MICEKSDFISAAKFLGDKVLSGQFLCVLICCFCFWFVYFMVLSYGDVVSYFYLTCTLLQFLSSSRMFVSCYFHCLKFKHGFNSCEDNNQAAFNANWDDVYLLYDKST